MKKKLTPQQTNRLLIEQQIIKIRLLENALLYQDARNNSILFGQTVDASDLTRAKEQLKELDRIRGVYESKDYKEKKLPYLSSLNCTQQMKDHYDEEDGNLLFVELKSQAGGKTLANHLESKSHINSRIKKKQMATKKKSAKKKAAPKKKAAVKRDGPTLKDMVFDLVEAGKDNAAILAALDKKKVKYSEKSVRWYASKARLAQKDSK